MLRGGRKTKLEGNQKPVIDDWYEDWKPIGRGVIWSSNQDLIRCAYCKRDLMTTEPTIPYQSKPRYDPYNGFNVSYESVVGVGVKTAVIQSRSKPPCKNEDCMTIWAMSGGLE